MRVNNFKQMMTNYQALFGTTYPCKLLPRTLSFRNPKANLTLMRVSTLVLLSISLSFLLMITFNQSNILIKVLHSLIPLVSHPSLLNKLLFSPRMNQFIIPLQLWRMILIFMRNKQCLINRCNIWIIPWYQWWVNRVSLQLQVTLFIKSSHQFKGFWNRRRTRPLVKREIILLLIDKI